MSNRGDRLIKAEWYVCPHVEWQRMYCEVSKLGCRQYLWTVSIELQKGRNWSTRSVFLKGYVQKSLSNDWGPMGWWGLVEDGLTFYLCALLYFSAYHVLSGKTGIPNQIVSFQVFILSIAVQLLFCHFKAQLSKYSWVILVCDQAKYLSDPFRVYLTDWLRVASHFNAEGRSGRVILII